MTQGNVERTTQWIYEGVWGVLTRWFRVPKAPPALPLRAGETLDAFRPSPGFLRYQKFHFWIWLAFFDLVIFVAWAVLTVAVPPAGLLLSPVFLVVAVLPDVLAYIAIHLRYDTTWYVLSPRSVRIRRGIWVLKEITITFENVQNVSVSQGPLQRYFGISNLRIDTAGGGSQQTPQGAALSPHAGIIEGVAQAREIQELILSRLKQSKSAGLGDDAPARRAAAMWTPAHLAALRDIRDALRAQPE